MSDSPGVMQCSLATVKKTLVGCQPQRLTRYDITEREARNGKESNLAACRPGNQVVRQAAGQRRMGVAGNCEAGRSR